MLSISHAAHLAAAGDRLAHAARRRSARGAEPDGPARVAAEPPDAIVIRLMRPADRPAVERLAGLDSRRVPAGDVLLAVVDGVPHAAVEVATGAAVADPFRLTAGVVALLQLRAHGLRSQTAPGRRSARRRRSEYRLA